MLGSRLESTVGILSLVDVHLHTVVVSLSISTSKWVIFRVPHHSLALLSLYFWSVTVRLSRPRLD
jgi:hypothetical protein